MISDDVMSQKGETRSRSRDFHPPQLTLLPSPPTASLSTSSLRYFHGLSSLDLTTSSVFSSDSRVDQSNPSMRSAVIRRHSRGREDLIKHPIGTLFSFLPSLFTQASFSSAIFPLRFPFFLFFSPSSLSHSLLFCGQPPPPHHRRIFSCLC